MKKYLPILALGFLFTFHAQEKDLDSIAPQLTEKITRSKEGQKLKWMDSLTNYSFHQGFLANDSLFSQTVEWALKLDSIDLAARQLTNQLNFLNIYEGKPHESLERFQEHEGLVDQIKDPQTKGQLLLNFADACYYTHQYQKSIDYYNIVEEIAQSNHLEQLVALAKLYRGESYSFNGNFVESSKDYQEAIRLFKKANDSNNLLAAQSSLATLYAQNGFFSEAKSIRDEAIIIAEKMHNVEHLVPIYFNNATDARKEGKLQEWIENLLLADHYLDLSERTGYAKPVVLSTLVEAYATIKDQPKAEAAFEKLQNYYTDEGLPFDEISFINDQKYLARSQNKLQSALTLGLQHLKKLKEGENFEEIMNAEKFLSEVYDLLHQPQQAYPHYKSYATIRDSVMDVQKINALSFYQTLYETEKRDAKIAVQENEIALLDAQNKIKKQWLWFGGLGLAFLFGAILLARSRNQAQRDKQLQERFSQELIQSQEEQQTRVSRELHDSVGQKLMLLTKKTKSLGNPDMEQLATNTLEELRSISRGLHPSIIEKLGVTAAIDNLIQEIDANTELFFTVELENIDPYLGRESGLHLYRIVQELLNNMVKHSQTKSASITLSLTKPNILLIVEENNAGFNLSKAANQSNSLGMKTLRERTKIIGGQLTFEPLEKNMVTKLTIPISNALQS